MPTIRVIKPLDQATGKHRLLAELKANLSNKNFDELLIVVAYAKSGPLHRLREELSSWRERGGKTQAIIGLDQQGTSKEALELALALFDRVHVTRERGVTFHPKIYIFRGKNAAKFYIGSNNLTVGGTETNFEASVVVELDPTGEKTLFGDLMGLWDDLLPKACVATRALDQSFLNQLVSDGHVLEEDVVRKRETRARKGTPAVAKSGLVLEPPSPLPPALKKKKTKGAKGAAPGAGSPSGAISNASGFAIQIKPHNNGEIFLSVTAALQNPGFFEYPFKGLTTTKSTGKPYPQRLPDPVANIQVYGKNGKLVLNQPAYPLNTVYYKRNSEIRITASPLVPVTPEYSVMIMRPGETKGIDYEIEIHRPDSPEYGRWVDACNQTMPGGGKTPRKYGWF